MTNVVQPHFKQNHLQSMAQEIMDLIHDYGAEHPLDVPQVIGVLELVKKQVIDDAIEEEYEDE